MATPEAKYADLQACCVCLGFVDENEYKIDADAPASIRSILRYLRHESVSCDIRRELGNLKILTSDLIPLLKVCKDDVVLFDLVIRLMVSLTQPAVVCFRNEIPKDRDLYAAFMKVDSILKDYKQAFADEKLFRVLSERVEYIFNKPWDERSDDDRILIERILILIRNVLHITPDASTEHRTDEDVSIHDQLLWTIHLSGWDDLILFLANTQDERGIFAFHILEIVSLMLREQVPEQIASAGSANPSVDANTQIMERCRLREKEKKRNALVELSMRQNRFGGTFELLGTKSISDRPLIYHHDVTAPLRRSSLLCRSAGPKSDENVGSDSQLAASVIGQVDLDLGKKVRRKACNRKPLIEREYHRRSVLSVQLFLQRFCWEFLRNCYNLLMSSARAAIVRQSTQVNDETYCLWAMHFFMAFARHYRFRPQLLSESLSVSVFSWLHGLAMGYREALLTDKRGGAKNQNALQRSRRLALAIAAYRQFLLCLHDMTRPPSAAKTNTTRQGEEEDDETVEEREERLRAQKRVAESLMANIFYVAEYQDLFVLLLREYNESIQSKEYLIDLVECTYLFINLLSAQERASAGLIVSRRQRRRQRNEQRRLERAAHRERRQHMAEARRRLLLRANETPEERASRLARTWAPLSANLLAVLAGKLQVSADVGARLFDPASAEGDGMAAQLRNAMRLVHTAMHDNKAAEAVALARGMWEIWPESAPQNDVKEEQDGDDEGDSEKDVEEEAEKSRAIGAGLEPAEVTEYLAMRKIFLLDLAAEELEVTESAIREEEQWQEEDEQNLIGRELEGSSEDDDEERAGMGALGSDYVDREVAFDISAFLLRFTHPTIVRSFTLLLANYAQNPPSTNAHLVHLLHKITVKQNLPGVLFQLRLFYVFQTIIKDPVVGKLNEFKEMLRFIKYILRKFFTAFEQSRSIAVEALFFKSTKEAAEAYSGYGTYDSGVKPSQWSPELDKELEGLFEAYRYDPVPRGEDIADVVKRNLSDPDKTRRQIIMRLIHLGKIDSAKSLKMMTIHPGEEIGRPRRRRQPRAPWTEEEEEFMRDEFPEYDGSEHRLDDFMTEYRANYEAKLRKATAEGAEPPVLRTRREIGQKLIAMGLARDSRDFGRLKRQSRPRRFDGDLEEVGGGIMVLRRGRGRRRRRYAPSPELVALYSDYSPPERREEQPESSEKEKEEAKERTVGNGGDERLSRSRYFDPEEDDSEESTDSSEEDSEEGDSEAEKNEVEKPAESSSKGKITDDEEEPAPRPSKRRRVDLDDEDEENKESAPVPPIDSLDLDKDFLKKQIPLTVQDARIEQQRRQESTSSDSDDLAPAAETAVAKKQRRTYLLAESDDDD